MFHETHGLPSTAWNLFPLIERSSSCISGFSLADIFMHCPSRHSWHADAPLGSALRPLLSLPMPLADVPVPGFNNQPKHVTPLQPSLLYLQAFRSNHPLNNSCKISHPSNLPVQTWTHPLPRKTLSALCLLFLVNDITIQVSNWVRDPRANLDPSSCTPCQPTSRCYQFLYPSISSVSSLIRWSHSCCASPSLSWVSARASSLTSCLQTLPHTTTLHTMKGSLYPS